MCDRRTAGRAEEVFALTVPPLPTLSPIQEWPRGEERVLREGLDFLGVDHLRRRLLELAAP